MAPNGLKWAKNDPKWLKNGPKMTFRYLGDLPGTKKGPKMRKNDPKRPFVAPNDLKWAKNGPKMTQNGPKMAQKKSPGAKSRKNCSPLSSIFDIEAPFQRYLPKSEILPILGSTLIFHFFMKFGQMVQVSKKMTLTYNRGEPQSRNGETAVFASGPKSQNRP